MKQVAGMAFAGAWWYKVTDIKACGTMNWPEPIVIVSDLHLNRHQDWKDRFRGLSGVWKDAGTVVFNGDLVDWDPWGREGYVKEIRSFAERECRLRGIVPVVLPGNVDWKISSRRHLELAGGRVLVTHGHIVYPGVSPWRPGHRLIERLRGEARAALSQDRRETLSGELEAAALALEEYYADIKKWRTCRPFLSRLVGLPWWLARPDSLWRLIRARHGHPAQAATILEKFNLPARFLIIGHFHRSGVWPIGQRVVINTGHYGRHLGSPMRVVISENLLRCEQVREEVDGYKVGPETARFHLSGQNPDTQSEQEPSRFAKWRDEGDSHEAAL